MDKSIKQLCNDLNLDKQTADDVWAEFTKVRDQFIIEGEQAHWLACAIYATTNRRAPSAPDHHTAPNSTNKSTAPPSSTSTSSTTSSSAIQHQSNGVSLTQLLRLCKLSLVDFLSLMDKWLKMTESSADIRSKISHLERNFNVSAVVFKKYKEIFPDVFKPVGANLRQSPDKIANRIRNPRSNYELSTADIYYFCWVLYVNIKGTRPAISEDLVNSYHLLLTCIDFCYSNALVSKSAQNVLNPNFAGLPENFHSEDFKLMLEQPMCILKVLCDKWDGIAVDAKSFREHWLKPYLKDLVNRKVLQVSHTGEQPPNMYLGIFDANNFENNMARLTKEHDVTMLSIGDFDERIFLSENALKELGAPVYDLNDLKRMITERNSTNNVSPSEDQSPPVDLDKQKPSLENGGRFVPQTPLSNRNYITSKIAQPSSPVANATRKVGDLYRMLAECTGEPTSSLEDIFKLCTQNPRNSILDRASRMVERFVESYTPDQDEPPAIELARKRADLARKLYFKVLESIIVREQKRLPTDKIGDSLSSLLSHEIFHISLFACCVEIVLASHNAKKTFPWVLEVYKDFGETHLYPFLFYKVIELVIREEERLSRDIVKHLATIEERVLDSMAWESDSPLWTAIAANGSIPSCQDVALPPTTNEQNPFEMSPLSSLRRHEGFQSPMPVSNRYGMGPLEGSARRRLFDGGLSGDVTSLTTNQPQILQVVMPHRTENGDIRYVILNASSSDAEHVAQRHEFEQSPTPFRPAVKANPVNLFFRKVYYLAQLRFRDLWTRLSISGADLQQKIWTLFEDQIRNHTNLLRDRHLDQMIMCATYAIIRVSKSERCSHFFQEIMRAYRFQPQANIEVYKNVLLAKPQLKLLDDVGSIRSTPTMSTRSPTRRGASVTSPVRNGSGQSSAGSSSISEQSNLPERGNIILFYNQVYLPQVRNLLHSFATQPDSSLKLSPLPRMNTHPISPWRRVSQQHSVYVSPLKCNSLPSSPGRQLSYNFHRSPAKDLQTINNMVNRQRAACKRILQDDDGENTKRPCISEVASKRINDIMNDRRASK
jgi:hypothetical protein